MKKMKKILHVEDEKETQDAVWILLKASKYDVPDPVKNVDEMMDACVNKGPYDLIILDWLLEGNKTGGDAFKWLKGKTEVDGRKSPDWCHSVPILFLSQYVIEEKTKELVETEEMDLERTEILAKPCSDKEFREKIKRLVGEP